MSKKFNIHDWQAKQRRLEEQNSLAAASSGVSITTGDGMGYMPFKKKKKEVKEQDDNPPNVDNLPSSPTTQDQPEEKPEQELSQDVELALKFINRINTKPEWVELINQIVGLEIKGMSNSVKSQTLRTILKTL